MTGPEINRELLAEFVDESLDALSQAGSLLVRLEGEPDNQDIINAVFRPVHSLKSNSAYFGLMHIKKLSHGLENILDRCRKGERRVTREVIDTLLPGIDFLAKMLSDVRDSETEIRDEQQYTDALQRVEGMLHAPRAPGTLDLERLDALLGALRPCLNNEGVSILDAIHALLPPGGEGRSAPPLSNTGGEALQTPGFGTGTHAQLLSLLDQGPRTPHDGEFEQQIAELLTRLHNEHPAPQQQELLHEARDIAATFTGAESGIDELACDMMREVLLRFPAGMQQIRSRDDQTKPDAAPPPDPPSLIQHKTSKTMRIPESALDDFLRCVGDLLGIEEVFKHILRQITRLQGCSGVADSFREGVAQFETVSGELRSRIMEVRKVGAEGLLRKAVRIARDVAANADKKITVETRGEGLCIDKSYIDLLDAPLTHMIRNAADHGIESAHVRTCAGKDEVGTIRVILEENEVLLRLVVQDDGAGLNLEALQKKGVELGLVAAGTPLAQSEVVDLLFSSGVSTAAAVTDVSGRGVGMDVVKRAIGEAGGKIEVESAPAQGTTFTITLPRNASTQIVDGYLVSSFSGELYVLALDSVVEAFRVEHHARETVAGKGEFVTRHGHVYPFCTLDSLLHGSASRVARTTDRVMGVHIDVKGDARVVAVADIVGIQKVVCKQIEGDIARGDLFSGAAVSGTGHVSMIINMEKLFSRAGEKGAGAGLPGTGKRTTTAR